MTPRWKRMPMFLGRFDHNLDAKGRLAIPARFREALAGGVVLTRGIDRCVVGYAMPGWDDLVAKVARLPMADRHARQFRRMIFAEAANLELDGQGRVVVPAELRAWAGIEREAVIGGVQGAFEIWAPERWREMQALVDRDSEEIASRLADLL